MGIKIEDILNKLNDEEKECIQNLINTTAMQALIINDMSRDLEDYAGAAAQNTAIQSASMSKLATLLNKPVVEGPSIEEINTASEEMRASIEQASSGAEAFDTILKFAVKVAPLFLI